MGSEAVISIFMATWIALGIAGFFLFHVNKNARFKKKCFPWFVAFVGVLFIAFVAGMGAPLELLLFMVPFVALITFLNIRGTSFCDNCGRTSYSTFLSRPEFCAKCGAKLDAGNRDHPGR